VALVTAVSKYKVYSFIARQLLNGILCRLKKKKCSSETHISVWMKTVRVIQQAISITAPQSDEYCQLHEARRVYKSLG